MKRRKRGLWFYAYHFVAMPGIAEWNQNEHYWFVGLKSHRNGFA